MIKTVALEKIFRTEEVETLALNKVSIEVKEGEFVAIMGPSGCGKSTLLNILGLLDNPTSGEYYLNGIEVSRYTEAQRTKLRKGIIGFVFQSFNLIDELNVYENIELPLLYMGVSAAERKKKVQEAMERMAIVHREKHFPQQLSGGQQQRVAIARAVVANPKLILADEPTGNLDSKNGQEVMNLLSELNKEGTTIVMVTHSQHDAGFASRTINLFDGQVGTDENVLVLNRTYANRSNAERAAKMNWERLQRGVATFSLQLAEGRADLYTEMPVKVSGFKQPIDDAEWTITTLTHTVNPDSGFTTSIELEVKIDDLNIE